MRRAGSPKASHHSYNPAPLLAPSQGDHGNDVMDLEKMGMQHFGIVPRAMEDIFRQARSRQDEDGTLVQVRVRVPVEGGGACGRVLDKVRVCGQNGQALGVSWGGLGDSSADLGEIWVSTGEGCRVVCMHASTCHGAGTPKYRHTLVAYTIPAHRAGSNSDDIPVR